MWFSSIKLDNLSTSRTIVFFARLERIALRIFCIENFHKENVGRHKIAFINIIGFQSHFIVQFLHNLVNIGKTRKRLAVNAPCRSNIHYPAQ